MGSILIDIQDLFLNHVFIKPHTEKSSSITKCNFHFNKLIKETDKQLQILSSIGFLSLKGSF